MTTNSRLQTSLWVGQQERTRTLSLSMYPELTEGQIACVAEAVKEFLR
jgi:dTDP-4-amino-4,6-dideoxygalactose transaminase